MIIVHGTIPIRPDLREQALAAARVMATASREEPGCISYEFYVGLSDPDTLLLFQEWESMEALVDHFDTPHMEVFVRELPTFVNGEISTRRYAVEAVDDDEEDDDQIEGEVAFGEAPRIIH
jgi:quinol monooxygenase YgiN